MSCSNRLLDERRLRPRVEQRRALYAGSARVAELSPYISLWYETNIAIADPQIAACICRRRAISVS